MPIPDLFVALRGQVAFDLIGPVGQRDAGTTVFVSALHHFAPPAYAASTA
jgi:hypothetical protein